MGERGMPSPFSNKFLTTPDDAHAVLSFIWQEQVHIPLDQSQAHIQVKQYKNVGEFPGGPVVRGLGSIN